VRGRAGRSLSPITYRGLLGSLLTSHFSPLTRSPDEQELIPTVGQGRRSHPCNDGWPGIGSSLLEDFTVLRKHLSLRRLACGGLVALAANFTLGTAFAQDNESPLKLASYLQSSTVSPFSYEFSTDGAYIGSGSISRGLRSIGDYSEISNSINFVVSDQIKDSLILRMGLEWSRYAFDSQNPFAPIPDVINALDLQLGADVQLSSALLMRMEIHPGFYGTFDNIAFRDINIPFVAGLSYFVSADFIVTLGVSVDLNSQIPVIPAVGVYWKLSDRWTIDGVAPRPQLQYRLSDKVTLFAGADVRETTFRMNDDFGTSHNTPALNSAILDYWEIRGGGGLTWSVYKSLKLDMEAGFVPYRRFDYFRADVKAVSSDWFPYVRVGLSAKF
jgi:Domain of unknown function (DUF6268)